MPTKVDFESWLNMALIWYSTVVEKKPKLLDYRWTWLIRKSIIAMGPWCRGYSFEPSELHLSFEDDRPGTGYLSWVHVLSWLWMIQPNPWYSWCDGRGFHGQCFSYWSYAVPGFRHLRIPHAWINHHTADRVDGTFVVHAGVETSPCKSPLPVGGCHRCMFIGPPCLRFSGATADQLLSYEAHVDC
jgi:hypothetical protein